MKTTKFILIAWFMAICLSSIQVASAEDEFQSHFFQSSDGVSMHYLEAGAGEMLVLVPGWTMPAEIWEHQIRYFATKYRVVALDPRGQGRSEKVGYGYQPSRRALDIGELLEHVGGGPAVVVGWSIAMQEVLVLTHEHGTDNIRAVVLVDYEVNFDGGQFAQRFIDVQIQREEWTREFVEAIFYPPQSDEFLEAMTQAALSMPTNAAAIMIGNLVLMGPTDLRPALDALDRPALFIASSQDWAIEQAELIDAGWPEIQTAVIDKTSHALFVDRPEEFNRVLEEFLSGLD